MKPDATAPRGTDIKVTAYPLQVSSPRGGAYIEACDSVSVFLNAWEVGGWALRRWARIGDADHRAFVSAIEAAL